VNHHQPGNDGWIRGALSGLPYAPRLDLLEMPAKVANQQVGKPLIERASNRKENPAMPVIDRGGELLVRSFLVTSARHGPQALHSFDVARPSGHTSFLPTR
jgi:hypothetical protein